jgi:tripartite-type tricarboxylate transporter receptor subunit TctC
VRLQCDVLQARRLPWLASVNLRGPRIYHRAVVQKARNRLGQRLITGCAMAWAAAAAVASTTLVVPYGAGGEADGSARNLQRSLARLVPALSIEVVHQTADSGALAARQVQAAPADGQTLLLARVGSQAVQPALQAQHGVRPGAFTVLAVLDQSPLVCAVRADAEITSMQALLTSIAAQPGRWRYGTSGPGTIQNLAVRYLLSLSGLPADSAQAVHFEQGTQATQALAAGRVDFICNNARSVIPLVQSGVLRGLMTTAQGRLKQLPQLRNAAELGLRDMQQLQGWSALVGPAGMPGATQARWRGWLDQVAGDPQWQAGTEELGAVARIRSIKNPAQFMREQALLYERLVVTLGVSP